ncbi:hypothetical protein EMGBS15_16150 [Filimonas sp.]|nr:hypothetical protein EMGBS15_16150 [Filimonas sp.]
MGIIKRQSLKSSIVNYIGVLLGVVFFNFIFPHLISKEYLGLIGLLQNIMWVFAALPALGLPLIMYKYFSNWKDEDTLSHFNAFALLAMAMASLLFVGLYMLLKQPIVAFYQSKSALFLPYYLLVIPLVIVQAYTQYFEMYCTMKLRVAVPTFLKEIATRLLIILLVYLFVYKVLDEQQFIYGFAVVYFISWIILMVYAIKGLHFKAFKPLAYLKDNTDIREQFAFGGSLLLLSCMFSIQNFIDGIMIPAYLGLGAFGIYGRPLVLGLMIHVPFRAISQISQPIIREAWFNNDLQKIKDLHKSISKNLLLIGGFLFTLLVANTDGLFRLLPPEYESGKGVLYIIATGRLLDMGFGLNNEILYASKHYRYIVYLAVMIVLTTIGLNMLLIPIYGMNGAALAVTVSLTLFNIFKTWIIYRKFGFHCFSKHYITLTLLILAVISTLHFIPFITFMKSHMFMNALYNVVFKSILGSVFFLVPLYFLKVSTDFNDFVKLILNGKIFKGGHKLDEL